MASDPRVVWKSIQMYVPKPSPPHYEGLNSSWGRPAGLKMLWDEMRGMWGDLPRPITRNQMEIPGVLEISCGDDAYPHMPSPHPTVKAPWNLGIIQSTGVKILNWLKKESQFEWENSDLTEFSQKWLGLRYANKQIEGLKLNVFIAKKNCYFFCITEWVTCKNSSATQAFSVCHISFWKVIQPRTLAPPFFNGVWKVVTNEHFAVSTKAILSEQNFTVTVL